MAIEFKCQGCQKTLRVPDEFAGRKAKCPNCQTILQVTAESKTVEPLDVQPPIGSSSSDLFAGLDSSDSAKSSYGKSPMSDRSSVATSNPYSTPQPPSHRRSGGAPHRGGLILGLGIGALVCNFCLIPGILALIFGMNDLRAMKEGRMDNEGHGLTLAGTIMGGIMTAAALFGLLLYALLVVVAIASGV